MKSLIRVLIFILAVLKASEGLKILGVFPTNWKSHWSVGASVLKPLARAGHDVTFVSPFELKEDNVKNVILIDQVKSTVNPFDMANISPLVNFLILPEMLENILDFTLSHPNFQGLLHEDYDVVIIEMFHSEALLGLGSHFNCPVIGVTTFGMSSYANDLTATPSPTSYIPNTFLKFTDKMNFLERLYNLIVWKMDELHLYLNHYPRQRKLYEKYFPNAVSFDKQRKQLALLFNNNFFSSYTVRPGMPNVIDIGGVHIEPAKPLPKDIEEFLDSADDGVILFSMGSIIQAVNWPIEKREAFVKAFEKLNQKVLWKYENETLPNKPDNVMVSKWIPQRDILAHPNVKLFITHGGLLGTTEALTEGVPVLGIPIFGDQKMNMNLAASRGYAKVLNFNDVTEESVSRILNEILSNDQITQSAKEASKIYTDRPMSPQNLTTYWVEYVVRHNGAKHLRVAGLDLNYFELHSIDVYLFVILLIAGVFLSMRTFIKFVDTLIKNDKKLKVN